MADAMRVKRLVPHLAAAAVVIVTVSLGNWQLRRADEKLVMQQARDAAERAGPVTVGVRPVQAADLDGRRVRATGHWVPQRTVFLDNRTHAGVAGFHVFTPLRLQGDPAMHLLVLRGWVARDLRDRTRLPPVQTPAGTVEVEGIAQARLQNALQLGDARAREGEGGRIWQALSLEEFGAWAQLPLQPVLLRQYDGAGSADGLVRDWPQPGSMVDRHRGYAVQWYAMAAAAVLLWLVFGVPKRHGRANPDE